MATIFKQDWEGFAAGTQAPTLAQATDANGKKIFEVIEYGRAGNLEVVTGEAQTGTKCVRLNQKKSDPEAQYGNKRTEINFNKANVTNRTWYAISYRFPADYGVDSTEEIILQFHDEDPAGQASTSPSVAIEIIGGKLRAAIRYSTGNYITNPGSRVGPRFFDLGNLIKGNYFRLVVNSNFGTDPATGFCKIWVNDTVVLDYKGPCGYIGSLFPYAKYGLYKWTWKGGTSNQTERTFFMDNIQFGDSSSVRADFDVPNTPPTPPANMPPICIVPDFSTDKPEIVLTATQTTDPDGQIVKYLWAQESGPTPATMLNADARTCAVSGLGNGTYVFSLTITDDKGASSKDFSSVVVALPPPPPEKKALYVLYDNGTWEPA